MLHSPSTSPSLITPGLKLSIWSEAGVLPCPSAPNRWHSFHLDDVRPLPWSRPVATFMAKDRFYYIDTYRCRGLCFHLAFKAAAAAPQLGGGREPLRALLLWPVPS